METKSIAGLVVGVIFAVLLIVVFIIKVRERRKIRSTGVTVEGVVIEIASREDTDGSGGNYGYIKYPVVRYVTLETETITKEYYIGYNPSLYEIGDAVKITYDRDEAGKFILDGKVKVSNL